MGVAVLDNRTARRLFLHKHALAEPAQGAAHGAELGKLVERLGFVQVDSINTVARAHDLIIHSRRPRYRAGGLAKHLERDRGLFEHWTHDAAIIPMAFYPRWRLKQSRDAARMIEKYRQWREGNFEAEFDRIRAHIEQNGASPSGVFRDNVKRKSGGWWDWHPGKTALEYLWRAGELEICHREGFTKFYNLTHRVIPKAIAEEHHTEAQNVDWFCRGALERLGFATTGEIADFWWVVRKDEAKDWASKEDLVEVDVQAHDGQLRRHLMLPETVSSLDDLPEPPGRMRVLSPFDPMLRDRNRAERLFGFDYRIEIFVPEVKRVYGYYVFPLLEGDQIVGRVDMKADRKAGVLRVQGLWPERGIKWGMGRHARFEAELVRMCRLAGVDEVVWSDGWLRETKL